MAIEASEGQQTTLPVQSREELVAKHIELSTELLNLETKHKGAKSSTASYAAEIARKRLDASKLLQEIQSFDQKVVVNIEVTENQEQEGVEEYPSDDELDALDIDPIEAVEKDLAYYMALPWTINVAMDDSGIMVAQVAELVDVVGEGIVPDEATGNLMANLERKISGMLSDGQEIPEPETVDETEELAEAHGDVPAEGSEAALSSEIEEDGTDPVEYNGEPSDDVEQYAPPVELERHPHVEEESQEEIA